MNSLSRPGGLRNGRLLSNPAARGRSPRLPRWRAGTVAQGANGWWQHGDGGYGWVGPLFWPFAYYDIYDYTIWGDYGFWDYGYPTSMPGSLRLTATTISPAIWRSVGAAEDMTGAFACANVRR